MIDCHRFKRRAINGCDEDHNNVVWKYDTHFWIQLNPAVSNSVISNSLLSRTELGFPLDLPFLQSFTMGYLELGYLEHPAISNCFSLPLAQINPSYLELYYVPKKHWSTLVRKCSQSTSWQDVLKARKRIDVLTVTKAKSDWLDSPLRMQKATSCRYLLI